MKPQRQYACAVVPDFPLQALMRSEPDLVGQPVAVVATIHSRLVIAHASPEAYLAGIRPGMTPAQAQYILPGLLLRAVSPGVVQAAHQALLDSALCFSPRVQDWRGQHGSPVWLQDAAIVVLDLSGTRRLYPSPMALGCALHAALRRLGFRARIAIASGPRLAMVAARGLAADGPDPVFIVPPGGEAAALAPLPLSAIVPSSGLLEALTRLGLRTVGDFARLDRQGLGVRFGLEAYDLHRLAHGEDATPFEPYRPEEVIKESVALDHPIEQVEPLLFVLGAAIERLALRLKARGQVLASLRLTLDLDPAGVHTIAISPQAPTADVRALLGLIRSCLERSQGPLGPIRGFNIETQGGPAPQLQTDLFGPPGTEPSRLATLLARLEAIAGCGRVGRPGLFDTGYRPRPQAQPFKISGTFLGPRRTMPCPTLIFRRLTPPWPADVRLGPDGEVLSVSGGGVCGPVLCMAGPWYIGSGWWSETPEAGAFYDVEVRGHGLFRLWHDLLSDQWFVEGWYD